jgi:hypothetical protein
MPWRHADLVAAATPGPPPPLSEGDRQFPDAVEDVVRRGLAPAPADRWPSVTAYVGALTTALGETSAPSGRGLPRWQALDPELTHAGGRPSPKPPSGTLPPPQAPNRGRRLVVRALVAALALAVGGAAGYLLQPVGRGGDATVLDETGSLEVTVPSEWEEAVGDQEWTPPTDNVGEYPALSVGTSPQWNEAETAGEGVFLGLFAGDQLPSDLPQHPECEGSADPITEAGDNPSSTVWHSDCPGGGVTIERVSQVAANRLLWVQVRSADRATANQVLDSIETHGL